MKVRISYYLKNQSKPVVFQSSDERSLSEIEDSLISSLKTMGLSCVSDEQKALIIKNDDVSAIFIESTEQKNNALKIKGKHKGEENKKPEMKSKKKEIDTNVTIIDNIQESAEKEENDKIPEIILDLPEINEAEVPQIVLSSDKDDEEDFSNDNHNNDSGTDSIFDDTDNNN